MASTCINEMMKWKRWKVISAVLVVVVLFEFYLLNFDQSKATEDVNSDGMPIQTAKVAKMRNVPFDDCIENVANVKNMSMKDVGKNIPIKGERKTRVHLTKTTENLKPWQAFELLKGDVRHSDTNGIECKQIQKFGNYSVCMDEPFKIKPPCLVYSFGINNDFSFDDAFGKLGCEVHSFDPSMLNVGDHQRGNNSYFHRLGLAGSDQSNFMPRKDQYTRVKKQTWEVRKLNTIKKMLGHTERKIDVLKLDIESYEWDALENFYEENILDDITQFLFEWHVFFDRPKRSELPRVYQLYEYLSVIGFRSHYKKQTFGPSDSDVSLFYALAETCWVNAKLKHANLKL